MNEGRPENPQSEESSRLGAACPPSRSWQGELDAVRGAWEDVLTGRPSTCLLLIETDPGQYTERFVDDLETLSRELGSEWYAGYFSVPRRSPYQVLAEVARQLAHRVDLSGPRWRPYLDALSHLVPDLTGEITGNQSLLPLHPRMESLRLIDFLGDFFIEIGREIPLTICLRDLHLAGPKSLELLQSLVRKLTLEGEENRETGPVPASRPSHLLVLATYQARDTDLNDGQIEKRWRAIQALSDTSGALALQLRPLSFEQLPAWIGARHLDRRLPARLDAKLFERSQGSPRLLDELLRRLFPGDGGGERDGASQRRADHIFQWLRNLGEALMERFQSLPAPERNILEALSVHGRGPIPEKVLGRLTGEVHLEETTDELAAGGEIEDEGKDGAGGQDQDAELPVLAAGDSRQAISSEEEFHRQLVRLEEQDFLHLREVNGKRFVLWSAEPLPLQVYDQLAPSRRLAYHRTLYGLLSRSDMALGQDREEEKEEGEGEGEEASTEELAHHAQQAGFPDLFRKHALKAADRLRSAQCLEEAAEVYEAILNGPPPLSPDRSPELGNGGNLHRELSLKLAEIYRLTKRFSRAREKLTVLLSAEATRSDPVDIAFLHRHMGDVYMEAGERTNACYFLEKSVRSLEKSVSSLPGSGGSAERLGIRRELCRALFSLGKLHLERGESEKARDELDRCLDVLVNIARGDELLPSVYLVRARLHHLEQDHRRALVCSLKAMELAQANGAPGVDCEAIATISSAYRDEGAYDKALEHLRRGVTLAESTNSRFDLALFYNLLGATYLQSGEQDRALECHQHGFKISRRLGDLRSVARDYNSLGNLYRQLEENEKAADNFMRAIDLSSRLNDQPGMAAGMTDLASILEREGSYGQALEYALRALEKRKKFGTKSDIALSYHRIASIHRSRGELDEGVKYAVRSWRIRKELGEKVSSAYTLVQLADLVLKQGKLLEAFQHSQEALTEFGTQGHPIGQLLAREIQARVFFEVGLLADADETLKKILEEAGRGQPQWIVGSCLLHLSRLAIERGNFHDAGTLLERSRNIFRQTRHRRQLAEATLEVCGLKLELGHLGAATECLEEAYSELEDLGIRDLVPRYFYLRSCIESSNTPVDDEAVRKYLQRGLVEASEGGLPDLQWRFQYRLGLLERNRGNTQLARIHLDRAKVILDRIRESLPLRYREHFYDLHERAHLLKVASELEEPGRKRSGPAEPKTARSSRRDSSRPPFQPLLHKQLMKIHEIQASLGNELNLRKLLEKIVDFALDLVNAERAFLILEAGDDDASEEEARTGESEHRREKYIEVARDLDREAVPLPERKVSQSITDKVFRSGRPFLSGDAVSEECFTKSRSVQILRLRSVLCVPLTFQRKVLGVLHLDDRHRKNAFDENDLNALQTLAKNAAIAITNARLIETNARRYQQMREAQHTAETFNIKLRNRVHKRTAQLAIAHAGLENRQHLLESRFRFENIIGAAKPIQEIFFLLRRLSTTRLPVLIQGESGTGKELIASAIHFNSPWKQGNFVKENCGAVSQSLMETELFGHKKGAFTGAVEDKKGLFELAHRGTLFLDEIGDMSLGMQQKILRVLEEGEIRPVGGRDSVHVDVRIISASNKELQQLVAEGKFREDLYYRLNGVRIKVPSLRERKEDIRLLVNHFLQVIAERGEGPPRSFSRAAIRALMDYDWPGNVRELRNVVERTVLMATGEQITEKDIHFDAVPFANTLPSHRLPTYREARNSFELQYIQAALNSAGGNVSQASALTGLSRESLYRLLRKHGVQRGS